MKGGRSVENFHTKDGHHGAGIGMSLDNAQLFVQKMREDAEFRSSVTGFGSSGEMWEFLKRNDFEFDSCDLVKAMAACMAALDQTS